MLQAVAKQNVTLLPGLFRERMERNRAYLLELDETCLLQSFYLEAGIQLPGLQVVDDPAAAKLHWGWESPTCQLRGHFLGHWLSAAAACIASEHDAVLRAKLDRIIAELARCQKQNGGEWVGPIPEKYFQKIADRENIWSPQYVMHKVILGLLDAWTDAGSTQALEILDHLSDWYLRWTEKMQHTAPHAVYAGESGGMPEVWARLYALTGAEKIRILTERCQNHGLFAQLAAGKDALTGCHANASIPLSHGAAQIYEVTHDTHWRTLTEQFWKNAVTDRGSYCTSSMNAGEFWVPPFQQGRYLSSTNQEFCTVYNMVRTASSLYRWSGNSAYADYIERCLYNGFLAQQNAETGMPTYFLPLQAGSRKKWGSKTHDFWCCHGTMVQAQMMYPGMIYWEDTTTDRLVVSQYIPSRLTCTRGGVSLRLEQTVDMKYYNDQAHFDEHDDSPFSRWSLRFSLQLDLPTRFTLSFRVPAWVQGTPTVLINGQPDDTAVQDGYLNLSRSWQDDTVQLFFPHGLTLESLPDFPELAAVLDGPIVLAGLTDADCGLRGDFSKPDTFLCPQSEHTYGTFPWKQTCYRTRGQDKNLLFRPLYDITDETYTVYFSKK